MEYTSESETRESEVPQLTPAEFVKQRPRPGFLSDVEAEITLPVKLNSLEETATYFGFRDVKGLRQFWESTLWKPFATRFLEHGLSPQRAGGIVNEYTELDTTDFETVAIYLQDQTSRGAGIFLSQFSDINQFNPIDHCCWAIYNLQYHNSNQLPGVFFARSILRNHHRVCFVWTMLQVWAREPTSSHTTKREEFANKVASQANDRQNDRNVDMETEDDVDMEIDELDNFQGTDLTSHPMSFHKTGGSSDDIGRNMQVGSGDNKIISLVVRGKPKPQPPFDDGNYLTKPRDKFNE